MKNYDLLLRDISSCAETYYAVLMVCIANMLSDMYTAQKKKHAKCFVFSDNVNKNGLITIFFVHKLLRLYVIERWFYFSQVHIFSADVLLVEP